MLTICSHSIFIKTNMSLSKNQIATYCNDGHVTSVPNDNGGHLLECCLLCLHEFSILKCI